MATEKALSMHKQTNKTHRPCQLIETPPRLFIEDTSRWNILTLDSAHCTLACTLRSTMWMNTENVWRPKLTASPLLGFLAIVFIS